MPSYAWLVMDNEAGLEHLSRRIASRIDHLIVVVNENPLSLDCARRIDRLLHDLDRDVRHRYFLLNAVRDDRAAAVQDKLAELDLEYLGAVPRDEAVEDAVFHARSIYALENTPAFAIISQIMRKIGAD